MPELEIEETFTPEIVNKMIGVNESYQAPDKLKEILWHKDEREVLFKEFLKVSTDMSFDWFRSYFQKVQADRGEKKQDFTPNSIVKVMNQLVGNSNHTYFEPAAGTGGIVIRRWYDDCLSNSIFSYQPSMYFYQVEELGDAAMPFLLFNLLIRGMNATVVYGDSLERNVKQVYFIQNENDDFMQFSSLNVMPHSEQVANAFDVNEWTEEPVDHIESKQIPDYIKSDVNRLMIKEQSNGGKNDD